jgi:hypothetical protein
MDAPPTAPSRLSSWLAWTLLIAAALGLRLWVIARTEVAARDSIGFIRYALRFESEPLTKVLKEGEQPPGYPATVWLVSRAVRAWRGDTSPETMVLSCQLASALMAALSVIPTVLLGRELGGRNLGWIAAAIFLCLPAWLRLTSDGVTEGAFVFWLATALWLGFRGLRKPAVETFLYCGLATGAAYLTRPEGLEVVLAVGAVLAARQAIASFRQPWHRVVSQSVALACGLLVLLGPYVAVIGRLSNKNTTTAILGIADNPEGLLPQYGVSSAGTTLLLADWFHESGGTGSRWAWAVRSVAREMAQGLVYVGLAFAAVGVIVFRPRRGAGAGVAALALLALLHAAVLCRMASLSGYLSERHTLALVFVACFPAAAGLLWLVQRLTSQWSVAGRPGLVAGSAVALGLITAAPALTKPLHYNRAGHKAAGQWLAKKVTDADGILDPFNWAEFYAGRVDPRVTTDRPERLFVVLETGDNQHSRLPHIPAAKAAAEHGELVYHWPANRPVSDAQVVVWSVRGDRLPDPATTNPTPQYRVGVKSASPTAAAPPARHGG